MATIFQRNPDLIKAWQWNGRSEKEAGKFLESAGFKSCPSSQSFRSFSFQEPPGNKDPLLCVIWPLEHGTYLRGKCLYPGSWLALVECCGFDKTHGGIYVIFRDEELKRKYTSIDT